MAELGLKLLSAVGTRAPVTISKKVKMGEDGDLAVEKTPQVRSSSGTPSYQDGSSYTSTYNAWAPNPFGCMVWHNPQDLMEIREQWPSEPGGIMRNQVSGTTHGLRRGLGVIFIALALLASANTHHVMRQASNYMGLVA